MTTAAAAHNPKLSLEDYRKAILARAGLPTTLLEAAQDLPRRSKSQEAPHNKDVPVPKSGMAKNDKVIVELRDSFRALQKGADVVGNGFHSNGVNGKDHKTSANGKTTFDSHFVSVSAPSVANGSVAQIGATPPTCASDTGSAAHREHKAAEKVGSSHAPHFKGAQRDAQVPSSNACLGEKSDSVDQLDDPSLATVSSKVRSFLRKISQQSDGHPKVPAVPNGNVHAEVSEKVKKFSSTAAPSSVPASVSNGQKTQTLSLSSRLVALADMRFNAKSVSTTTVTASTPNIKPEVAPKPIIAANGTTFSADTQSTHKVNGFLLESTLVDKSLYTKKISAAEAAKPTATAAYGSPKTQKAAFVSLAPRARIGASMPSLNLAPRRDASTERVRLSPPVLPELPKGVKALAPNTAELKERKAEVLRADNLARKALAWPPPIDPTVASSKAAFRSGLFGKRPREQAPTKEKNDDKIAHPPHQPEKEAQSTKAATHSAKLRSYGSSNTLDVFHVEPAPVVASHTMGEHGIQTKDTVKKLLHTLNKPSLPESEKIRATWEKRIAYEDQRQRLEYGALRKDLAQKRWRSLEVLSASLIATHDLLHQPYDARPPTTRVQPKATDQEDVPLPSLGSNNRFEQSKSVDNLYLLQDMRDTSTARTGDRLWYDRSQIREAVSHESIADASQTKQKWEAIVRHSNQASRNTYHPSGRSLSVHNVSAAVDDDSQTRHVANGSAFATEDIKQQLNVMQREMDEYRVVTTSDTTHTLKGAWPPATHNRPSPFGISPAPAHAAPTHTQTPPQMDELEKEKELLLCYLESRPEVAKGVGIVLPPTVQQRMRQHAARNPIPRVALLEIAGDSGLGSQAGSLAHRPGTWHDSLPRQHQRQNSGDSRASSTGSRSGRYIKNSNQKPSSRRIATAGLPFVMSKRLSYQNGATGSEDRDSPDGPASPPPIAEDEEPLRGENLIAREIRDYRRRENELQRTRSQLGLPSLDEMLNQWKHQEPGNGQLRSAHSMDHLHVAATHDNQHRNSEQRGSLDATELHNDALRYGSLDRLSNAVGRNGAGANRVTTVGGRGTFLREPHNDAKVQLRSKNEGDVAASRYDNSQDAVRRSALDGDKPKIHPYDRFLQAYNGKPVAEAPSREPFRRKRPEYVPVENRIEQEMQELRQREDELRARRETMGLSSFTAQESDDQSDDGNIASEYQIRSREYVGQRNPTFDPAYSRYTKQQEDAS